MKSGEPLGEVATAIEFFDHFNGILSQWSVSFAISIFIMGAKFVPSVVDDLPERRGARTARAID